MDEQLEKSHIDLQNIINSNKIIELESGKYIFQKSILIENINNLIITSKTGNSNDVKLLFPDTINGFIFHGSSNCKLSNITITMYNSSENNPNGIAILSHDSNTEIFGCTINMSDRGVNFAVLMTKLTEEELREQEYHDLKIINDEKTIDENIDRDRDRDSENEGEDMCRKEKKEYKNITNYDFIIDNKIHENIYKYNSYSNSMSLINYDKDRSYLLSHDMINSYKNNIHVVNNKFWHNTINCKRDFNGLSFWYQCKSYICNNIIDGCGISIFLAKDVNVTQNKIINAGRTSIYVSLPSSNVTVCKNIIECRYGPCIITQEQYSQHSENIKTYTNNNFTVIICHNEIIGCDGFESEAISIRGCKNILIDHNLINIGGGISLHCKGIKIYDDDYVCCKNCEITSNIINFKANRDKNGKIVFTPQKNPSNCTMMFFAEFTDHINVNNNIFYCEPCSKFISFYTSTSNNSDNYGHKIRNNKIYYDHDDSFSMMDYVDDENLYRKNNVIKYCCPIFSEDSC